jgi:hypothetical protein
MSRRRQSYRAYVAVTDEQLQAARYGTRSRRDRSHLALLSGAESAAEPAREPTWWPGVALAGMAGVALMPAVYGCAWAISGACAWLAGVLP